MQTIEAPFINLGIGNRPTKEALLAKGREMLPSKAELAAMMNKPIEQVKKDGAISLTPITFLLDVAILFAAVLWLQPELTGMPEAVYNLGGFVSLMWIVVLLGISLLMFVIRLGGGYSAKDGDFKTLLAFAATGGRPKTKVTSIIGWIFMISFTVILVAGGHFFWTVLYLVSALLFAVSVINARELQLACLGAIRLGMKPEEGIKIYNA